MQPSDEISAHFRLIPAQIAALRRLNMKTIDDLLHHFPARYDKSGNESEISGLQPGAETVVFGTIDKLDTRRSWKRKIPIGEGVIRDASGSIKIMWFHQPYLAKKFV